MPRKPYLDLTGKERGVFLRAAIVAIVDVLYEHLGAWEWGKRRSIAINLMQGGE